MNWIRSVYLTREGRVSRKTWWLGVIGLFVASLILTALLSLVGLGMVNTQTWTSGTGASQTVASAGTTSWGSLIIVVLFAYPSYCLSIKRRHDRDKAGLDFQIWFGLTFVFSLLSAFTSTYAGPVDTAAVPSSFPAAPVLGALAIASLAILAFGIYMLVVLGFLRGTVGNNSYGADPAGGTWAPAA